MVAIIDSPDFMLNDISVGSLTKRKKIYLFFKGLIVGFIYKNLNGKTFCNFINLLFPKRSKINYKNGQYFKYIFDDKLISYPNKRIVRVVNNYEHHLNFLFESYCLNKISFKSDDYVVDCGANVGELLYCFYQKKLNINYIAFEPDPHSFTSLSRNLNQFENTEKNNLGLSNKDGREEFFIDSLGGNSSLEYFGNDDKTMISTITLDSLNLKKIKLLKLEAEGHEEEVLLGAIKTLKHVEFISVDYGPEKGTDQEPTTSQVVKVLYRNNFELISTSKHRQIGLFKNTNYEEK